MIVECIERTAHGFYAECPNCVTMLHHFGEPFELDGRICPECGQELEIEDEE